MPQPDQQPKTIQNNFCWSGIIIGKKNHTTTTTTTPPCDYILATSRQPRKLIFGKQLYFYPTRRNKEDDLNIFENGRRPKYFENGRRPQYF